MALFPRKKIPYPDVRFKTETFWHACEKMINEARAEQPEAYLNLYFSVSGTNRQEKTYRDQEEFFAEYRVGQFEAAYASWGIAGRDSTSMSTTT